MSIMTGLTRRKAELQRAAEVRADCILAYQRVFTGSDAGRLVLADLLARCGFTPDGVENPSYRSGQRAENTAYIEGMKEPVRHILATIGAKLTTPQNNE